MLDPKIIRQNPQEIAKQLQKRGMTLDVTALQAIETERKTVQQQVESLQNQRNQLSKAIGIAKQKGEEKPALFESVAQINDQLADLEKKLQVVLNQQQDYFLNIPNLPDPDVPEGKTEADNVEIKKWGEPKTLDFTPKDHVDLTQQNQGLDFKAAAALSGARFVVMRDKIAQLHRALIQFMLNLHTQQHGYEEVYVPYIVNENCLYGSGQWPKLKADSFVIEGAQQVLIPTAEVPLVNLVREQIIEEAALPLKWVAHTPCFRKEAGSYGKDTRGMLRHHQFDKVELVQIVSPEQSKAAHADILRHAETVLQQLALPYRVVLLCGGDLGFSMNKTYDLEVWLPGEGRYREISSCSHADSFQARRMKARFKRRDTRKIEWLHTLNGSGLAVGRTLIAVIENYQCADGSIIVPEVLRPFMQGLTQI